MCNHPWRRSTHMFTCDPDCTNRKPGCQDNCEKHIKEKAEWDKRKAIEDQRNLLDYYTNRQIAYYKDRRAKCSKGGYLKKADGSKK